MRLIRLLLLALTVGVSYIAQSIFDQRHLTVLLDFPLGAAGTLGIRIPGLSELDKMSPDELVGLGMFTVLLASIGFGLVSSRLLPIFRFHNLPEDEASSTGLVLSQQTLRDQNNARPALPLVGSAATLLGVALVLVVAAQVGTFGVDTPFVHAIWLGGLLLFLIGSIGVQRTRYAFQERNRSASSERGTIVRSLNGNLPLEVRPTDGWPLLLVVLLAAMILYLWQLWRIPARIDHVVAEIGLQSLDILRGNTTSLFFSGMTDLPMLAYVPSALMIELTGDPLFGVRLAGVGSGLLMIISTWLLCCELLRRVPRISRFGTILEDDGRWIALLAAMIVAFGHVTLHYSRLPIYLGPVAWGTLGMWALLRGLRRQHLPSLALSGMMIGLAGVLYAGGLFFVLVAPLWWIGVWFLNRHWFYADGGTIDNQNIGIQNTGNLNIGNLRTSQQALLVTQTDELSLPRYTGNESFFYWLGGLVVVLAPFLASWFRFPYLFTNYLQTDYLIPAAAEARNQALAHAQTVDYHFLDNLRLTLFTFNIYPNSGSLLDITSPFLNGWLAPLLFLGLGALVLNLDRLPGWLLLISFFVGIISGAVSLSVPFWLRLLPLIPLVAIVIAFAIDRIRVALLETAGTWLEQTTVYLAIGFIAWASMQGWLTFYDYGLRQEATSSHVGRAIQAMDFDQTAVLLLRDVQSASQSDSAGEGEQENARNPIDASTELSDLAGGEDNASQTEAMAANTASILQQNGLDATVIEFIASNIDGPRERIVLEIGEWPDSLPERSRLLIQPSDSGILEEIKQRYGEGQLTPVRNLRGDPALYIYDIW